MHFIRITQKNTELLQRFVARAGKSLETFRYFSKRPFSVVENHVCTWVMEVDGEIEAYGHLDKEDETVWLGIAVTDVARGKGLGKKMMQRLMDSAAALGLEQVKLSVDNANGPAIKLYEDFGFVRTEKKETLSFFEWTAPVQHSAVMSTLAFMGKSAEEIIGTAQQNNLAVEFSSGVPYRADMEDVFLAAPVRRYAHNYFPAPEVPFVLNLASADETIRQRSIEHCIRGMRLSHAVGAPFFSAHAGFCIDPKPDELGRQLSRVQSFDRNRHWKLFLDSLEKILAETENLPTGFLAENNVLAKMNVYEDGSNPLLCVDADEMLRMLSEIPDPRLGILLDTAHLKVSSVTLGFDLVAAAQKILPHVRCIHHSDNDGLHDNNQPFGKDYWFLPLVKNAKRAVQVIEVRKQGVEELKGMEKLLF